MLQITGLFASILGILIILLAYKVVSFRRSNKVGIGDNGDKSGILAIRAHANAIEYIPMLVILMGIYEVNGGNVTVLYVIGALAVVARFMHAFGLSKSAGVSTGRFYGTALTWLITVVLSVLNIVNFALKL
ncbi:MAG: MAPEG family protein [Marinicellaceae bacterium]